MTSDYELAKMLFPKPRDIVREATAGTPKTSQVRGVATSDSADGSVSVILDTVAGGDNAEMTVPTAGGIVEGSDVIVTLLDGTPVEVDQPGSIDNANARIDVLPDQIISTVSETYATKDEALNTASGSGRSITTTDAAGLPLRDLTVYGESVQEGTPTPDAPVEIRTVSGVNLADPSAFQNGYMASTSAGTVDPGLATPSATMKEQTTAYIPVVAGESYTFYTANSSGEQGWLAYRFFDSEYTTIANRPAKFYVGEAESYAGIVAPSNAAYVRMSARMYDDGVMMVARGTTPYVTYGAIGVQAVGENLLPKLTAGTYGTNGVSIVVDSNGVATLSGTTTASGNAAIIPLEQPITITQQMVDDGVFIHLNNSKSNASAAPNFESNTGVSAFSYVLAPANRIAQLDSSRVGKTIDRVRFWLTSGVTLSGTFAPAILASSTATPYEPYRESISYIPMQGHSLASLPDGTRDVLHVENGRAWIDAATATTTTATTDGITATVGVDAMSTTGDLSDGATVIYAATPSTIDLGEVSLPTVQDGDTVRIIAEVQPVFDTSWWRDTAIVDGMEHAQNTADSASSGVTDLRVYTDSRLEQTSRDITATFTESIEAVGGDVDGITERVSTIENTVKISSEGVTIAASDSPISANLNNAGLVFSAGDEAVLTLNAQTSTAEADRVSIGHYQWREMGDNAIALVWIGA